MYELILTICLNGQCQNKVVERDLIHPECVVKMQTTDAGSGALGCTKQHDKHGRPYTLLYHQVDVDSKEKK